jgi:hypothetical protein
MLKYIDLHFPSNLSNIKHWSYYCKTKIYKSRFFTKKKSMNILKLNMTFFTIRCTIKLCMIFVNILFVYPNLSVIQKSDQSTLGSEVNLRQKFIYFPTANHIRDHSFCGWFVMIVLGFWLIILENKNLIYKKKNCPKDLFRLGRCRTQKPDS